MTQSIVLRLAAVALACVAGIGAGGSRAATGAPQSGEAVLPAERAAKKPCRTVVKKVKGKRRRVRVCPRRPVPKVQNVALGLDTGRTASATIGAAGGTATATAAGGAVLTLSVPAGALGADKLITLTPVSALRGVRGLTLRAGVQFGPDGLALAKPATLTISAPNAAATRALAWWEAGADVSRYPSRRSGADVQIAVTHFSGVALAAGTEAAWNTLRSSDATLRARYARDVKPALDRAADEDPLASSTFDGAFAWEREVELLGLGGAFEAEKAYIRQKLAEAIVNALSRAETRCDEAHDFAQIERLVRLDRQAQLWGVEVPGESGFTRAVECARFSLDVEFGVAFQLVGGGPLTQSGELRVRAANLVLEPGSTLTPQGARTPEVVSWQFTHRLDLSPVMTCTGGPAGTRPLEDVQATLQLVPATEAGGNPAVSLRIDPGDVEAMAQVSCSTGGSAAERMLNWPELWKHAFADRLAPDGRLVVQVLPPLGSWIGGEVLATYGPETRTIDFGTAAFKYATTVTWNMTLRHAPAA